MGTCGNANNGKVAKLEHAGKYAKEMTADKVRAFFEDLKMDHAPDIRQVENQRARNEKARFKYPTACIGSLNKWFNEYFPSDIVV